MGQLSEINTQPLWVDWCLIAIFHVLRVTTSTSRERAVHCQGSTMASKSACWFTGSACCSAYVSFTQFGKLPGQLVSQLADPLTDRRATIRPLLTSPTSPLLPLISPVRLSMLNHPSKSSRTPRLAYAPHSLI